MIMATPHNITELERLYPVTDEERSLIDTMFKECYTNQIYTWAVMNKKSSKRGRLFAFLRGESGPTTPRNVDLSASTTRQRELVFQRSNCQIDFNQSFQGKAINKQVNKQRFSSPGVDDVFHKNQPVPSLNLSSIDRGTTSSLPKYIIKKLMSPEGIEKCLPRAEEYPATLQELAIWCEKKDQTYPVDKLFNDKYLSPRTARESTKAKMGEDHFFPPGYDPTPSLTPRTMGATRKFVVKTGETTYTDFYGMDYRCGGEAKPSVYLRPVEHKRSFASFPSVNEPIKRASLDVITNQSKINLELGKFNKKIFESETCL